MFKITIDNEEVITDKDFTIEEEMLNTPSVILNNVYPKEWEQDKDYLNFYHPNEYSKCKIYDEEIIPASEGDYIEGTDFSITYDDTKEFNLLSLKGETSQGTTTGRNLFDKSKISSVNNGTNNNGVITSTTNSSAGTKNVVIAFSSGAISVPTNTTIYFSADIKLNSNSTGTFSNINDNVNGGTTKILRPTLSTTYQRYQTSFKYNSSSSITAMLIQITNLVGSVEISNIMISTSSDAIYEIFTNGASPNPSYPQAVDTVTGRQQISVAGKNLFDKENANVLNAYISTGTKKITSNANDRVIYIKCKPNTQYTVSKMVQTPTSDNRFVIGYIDTQPQLNSILTNLTYLPNGTTTTNLSITTDANAQYLVCGIYHTGTGTTFDDMLSSIQIEKGNQPTTYEAYKGHNYELNLGKNLFDDFTRTTDDDQYGYKEGNTYISLSRNGSACWYFKMPVYSGETFTISYTDRETMDFKYRFSDTDMNDSSTIATYVNNGTNITQSGQVITNTTYKYFYMTLRYSYGASPARGSISNIMLEKGTQATSYSPYKEPIELCKIGNFQDYIFKNTTDSDFYDNTLEEGAWYLHKEIGKVILDGSETWVQGNPNFRYYTDRTGQAITTATPISNYFKGGVYSYGVIIQNQNATTMRINLYYDSITGNYQALKTWLQTHNTTVYYVLDTPTTELIEDTELLGQLEEVSLLNGLNNISVTSPYLTTPIKIHYNFNEKIINQDLYFCGVVKNSGNISLNPREPHFQSLQVLSYKTFLSEGETLDFVIYQKTIREAIEQVVSAIQDYGFIVGDINILNPDEIIGAYSTKDKSAYDVFQYIADITQSRWTTRMIDEDTIAIDFYDPSLMQLGTTLDYTQEFFEDNLIDDMSYSYGTNDYRNKQIMTSQEVYSNINQIQNIVANGYQTQFNTEQQIGKINSIKIGGVDYTFATNTEKDMGVIADFYYSAGNNYFESASTISIGTVIVIDYLPIVEGRQIITNSNEIDRVANSTGVKGVVARYENRNDATTSTELQLIGQSYIKYKGVPEIVLTVITRKNIWDVGQRVQFNAPINELAVMYMVRKKAIHRITTIDTIFYTFELVSSFNSETAVNYFDNQRAKANGNIGEGEYISRNIDIQSTANIIFYDTQANEITVVGDNILNCTLESPFVS